MKSVVLCEGRDDLWFISYYLHKTANWNIVKPSNNVWKNYRFSTLTVQQDIKYLTNGSDHIAIWSVCGKDHFDKPVFEILRLISEFPFDAIDSIVVVRDRDNDEIEDILRKMNSWFDNNITLRNKTTSTFSRTIEDYDVSTQVTPVIIPFTEQGAIETIFKAAIEEEGEEEAFIVREADKYISTLVDSNKVGIKYLSSSRLILKAKYSAVISATNPDHSTGLFQDMVMACSWEKSQHVKEHFDVILNAVTMQH
jgi:hypothetical protein